MLTEKMKKVQDLLWFCKSECAAVMSGHHAR